MGIGEPLNVAKHTHPIPLYPHPLSTQAISEMLNDNVTVKVVGACGVSHQDILDLIAVLVRRSAVLEEVPEHILKGIEATEHL